MNKPEVLARIRQIGVVPVVRAASADDALRASDAVQEGGIPIVEITMTVPGALDAIRSLARKSGGDVVIGAGTVLDEETAQACLDAGAVFLVSPGLDLPTVALAKEKGVAMLAGALSPTEVMAAWKAGADMVKIFPCGTVGGARYIKALRGPFPRVPMVPTGGVNATTAADFIVAGAAALGVGSELVDPAALEARRTEIITSHARALVDAVRRARAQLENDTRSGGAV
jgi:2-dehydro-3-deoxyphosphogluconate aldolase/(4S)-4-hydroxy-2-oxoglutarate aldolase